MHHVLIKVSSGCWPVKLRSYFLFLIYFFVQDTQFNTTLSIWLSAVLFKHMRPCPFCLRILSTKAVLSMTSHLCSHRPLPSVLTVLNSVCWSSRVLFSSLGLAFLTGIATDFRLFVICFAFIFTRILRSGLVRTPLKMSVLPSLINTFLYHHLLLTLNSLAIVPSAHVSHRFSNILSRISSVLPINIR